MEGSRTGKWGTLFGELEAGFIAKRARRSRSAGP